MRSSICRGGGSSHATSACAEHCIDDPFKHYEYADPYAAAVPLMAVHAAGRYLMLTLYVCVDTQVLLHAWHMQVGHHYICELAGSCWYLPC